MLRRLGARQTHLLLPQQRMYVYAPVRSITQQTQTKMITGAGSAVVSATCTMVLFHLLVTPVSSSIFLGVVGGSMATGALSAFEGDKDSESGTNFGAVTGLLLAMLGGYYAKVTNEPWRKPWGSSS